MPLDEVVAGISCGDVLANLSDYLDGELAPDRRAAVAAHVVACSNCARFGGMFTAVVAQVRAQLADEPALDAATDARLRARLADER